MRNSHGRRLALIPILLTAAAPLIAIACGGDDGAGPTPTSGAATPASTRPISTATAATATSAATDPTATSTIEVQGVVGAVDLAARTIDIKPTGDAKFTKIVLSPATTIRRAGGGSVQLRDVRPSDRIIALGRPGDDPAALLSTDVTIQQVIPGAQPGG